LITGSKGVFDVRLGDELLFSKHQAGRFPDYSEIKARLVPLLGAGGGHG
jgi:predicted Rdx family selenoprotein